MTNEAEAYHAGKDRCKSDLVAGKHLDFILFELEHFATEALTSAVYRTVSGINKTDWSLLKNNKCVEAYIKGYKAGMVR